MFHRTVLCAAALAFATAARAQPLVVKTEGRLEAPLRFGRMDLEDGLPSLGVYAITQDARGFMWFGTQQGLARYDGRTVKVFAHDPDDKRSLSSSDVRALASDSIGALWVGTTEGLNRLDPVTQSFRRYYHEAEDEQSLAADGVESLLVDSKGTLWVGTVAGLNRLDEDGTISAVSALTKVEISSIIQSSDGMLFIGTTTDGVVKYDPDSDKVVAQFLSDSRMQNSLSGDHVTALLEDSTGTLWIATHGHGLNALELQTKRFTHHRRDPSNPDALPDDLLTTLLEGPDGDIWIGTKNSGLVEFDRKRKIFIEYKPDQIVPDRLAYHQIESAHLDRGGVVWIGTMAGGISTFDLLKIEFAAHRTGSTVTTCFVEDAKGYIWIGTTGSVEGSGLYRFDLRTRSYVRYSRFGDAEIDRYWITSCIRDKKGKLWFGGERFGVLGLDPETESFEYLPMTDQGDGANLVYALAQAKGRIWIGTWGAGLFSYDPKGKKFEQYRADPEDGGVLLSDAIYRIVPDLSDPDILWIGTGQGGLSKFHISDGTSNNYTHVDEDKTTLSDNNVVSILQLGDVLWIGTYGFGLNRLDLRTNKITRFGKEQGIAGTILGILADPTGRLWLSTNGDGLIVFDPAREISQQYLARDGLQSREFAQGSYYKDSKGIFYFGGPRGFNAFNPVAIKPDSYEPPITLTQIKILEEEVDLGRPPWMASSMELGFTDSVVSFEFAALAFADPENNRYQYRMKGLYDDWISTDQGIVSYSKLDDGRYAFEVRAIGRHGAISQATTSMALRVRPAPWDSWWAYVIYGLILAGIVFAYVRYQNQRVKALEQANRLSAVERDLELTAAVQIGCLPENPIIREDDFTAFGVYNPAERCSGDWWWYERSPDGHHWIIVGDVTGHGAGPAMVTAAVAAAFRVQSDDLDRDPFQRFDRVNKEVMSVARGKYHMVLSAVEINPETGQFVIYSAGGLPVLVMHNGAKPTTYGSPGTPLGRENFELGRTEGRLNPGDRILVLTDGLPEIELPNGKLFGMRRVAQAAHSTVDLPVDAACQRILEAAMNAKGTRSQSDDWTFVLGEWEPKGLRPEVGVRTQRSRP